MFHESKLGIDFDLEGACWYRGSFLLERAQPVKTAGTGPGVDQLMEAWTADAGLRTEELWRRRLDAEGLDLGTFRSLLATIDEPDTPTEKSWISLLKAILTRAGDASSSDREEVRRYSSSFGFAAAAWPFLLWAGERYRQCWRTLEKDGEGLPFAPEVLTEHFLWSLTEQLTQISMRTLTLELNVARLRGQLSGQTAQQRFLSFTEQRLGRAEDILRLLQEYPVLARLLVTRTTNWVGATTQAMERYCEDRELISGRFGPGLDQVVEVSGGLSDPHRRGRSALAFAFRSGARLMYKPKPLAASRHFQEVLRWANERGADPPFPTLTVLDRGEYGWEEFVEARGCTSVEQVRRFYRRQGGYLALLYALRSTDFHYENVVAAGEHPYLVDLETLFEHRVEDEHAARAANKTSRLIHESVLGTGLLPEFMSGSGEGATNLSGLGGTERQLTPVEVLRWEGVGTDDMRAVRRRDVLEEGSNQPRLGDQPEGIVAHTENFVEGFDDIYRMLTHSTAAFSELVLRFRDDPVRHVLRPTFVYGLFQEGGRHPDFLRNGMDRDRLMDRLWISLRYAANAARVVPSERNDLLNDDVPYFHTKPGSKDLWDSRDLCIRDFFETDSLTDVLDRCRALSDEDREFQKGLIRASLGVEDRAHLWVCPAKDPADPTSDPDPAELVDAAVEIADHLEQTAVWGDDGTDVSWVSSEWLEEDKRRFTAASAGLYNGVSGIAFFLAYLAKVCGQDRFERMSRAALRSAGFAMEDAPEPPTISAFTGRASLIYALTHCSRLWEDPSLMQRALRETELLEGAVTEDSSFDLLNGCAGTIMVLLNLHRLTKDRLPYEVAVSCGEHLLAHAIEMPSGHGWKSAAAQKPLAGLSHGAAGIALALFALARASGEERFAEMAQSALRYERSLYHPGQKNWLDLRTPQGGSGEGALIVAWCNGAPGIGIMRMLCADEIPGKRTEAEIQVALETTLRAGFGRGQSLCHGDFGNLEVLLLAARRRGDADLLRKAKLIGKQSLEGARARGRWVSGWETDGGDEEPGLMVGISGIGLGLLRLADDLRVPSPLYLAPPN